MGSAHKDVLRAIALARILARPQTAGDTLRAFGNVWKELPKMLRAQQL